MAQSLTCDNCGVTAPLQRADNWLVLGAEVHRREDNPHLFIHMTGDFCSSKCLLVHTLIQYKNHWNLTDREIQDAAAKVDTSSVRT